MKATVKDFLNVRVGAPRLGAPSFQYLAPGSILDVEEKIYKGDLFEGIDTWVKDEANNYYWSGGVTLQTPISELLKLSTPEGNTPKSYGWFNKIKISDIWKTYEEKGKNSTIAVLDTGFNASIPDVANSIVRDQILITPALYPGIQLVKDDQSNMGHGTRCLSIVGARNSKDYIIGIAPESKLISGKISIDREVRDFNVILNGIEWAINSGAEVISISYAVELNQSQIKLYNDKYQNLIKNKKVLVFAACGNSGNTQIHGERYPASFENCISVGATDQNGNLSSINILSDKTILHGQGVGIESYSKSTTPDPESGTSFSTPLVAGVAALAISFLKHRDGGWDSTSLLSKLLETSSVIDNNNNNQNKKSIDPINLFKHLNP